MCHLALSTFMYASIPPFTRAPRSGFEPGSTRIDPGYVHTGSNILVVNDVTPEMATLRSLVQDKMAATAMIVIFLCFGLLSMAWIRQRRRMRFRRRRRRPCAESLALLGLRQSCGRRCRSALHPEAGSESSPRSISATAASSRDRSTFAFLRHFLTLEIRLWRNRIVIPDRNPAPLPDL